MDRTRLDSILGDYTERLDDDQKDELVQIATDIDSRYDTEEPGYTAAFLAAVAYMLGDTNIDAAARTYRDAQQRRDNALAAAIQVAAMSGLSEAAAAETIGVNRRTVRRHLGKE